jgi:uncharacterized protein (DUF736 family)
MKGKTMTTIAKLTKQKDGSFTGTFSTLALHAAKITISPVEGGSEKAPAFRVFVGDFEAGAVWKKTSKAGNAYYSVKLDDASFAQPIYCVFVKTGDTYLLEWNRKTPNRSTTPESTKQAAF